MPDLPTRDAFIEALEPLECPICQNKYSVKHSPTKLDCGHIFGIKCLTTWAETDNEQAHTCPMCRQALFEPEAEQYDSENEDDGIDENDIQLAEQYLQSFMDPFDADLVRTCLGVLRLNATLTPTQTRLFDRAILHYLERDFRTTINAQYSDEPPAVREMIASGVGELIAKIAVPVAEHIRDIPSIARYPQVQFTFLYMELGPVCRWLGHAADFYKAEADAGVSRIHWSELRDYILEEQQMSIARSDPLLRVLNEIIYNMPSSPMPTAPNSSSCTADHSIAAATGSTAIEPEAYENETLQDAPQEAPHGTHWDNAINGLAQAVLSSRRANPTLDDTSAIGHGITDYINQFLDFLAGKRIPFTDLPSRSFCEAVGQLNMAVKNELDRVEGRIANTEGLEAMLRGEILVHMRSVNRAVWDAVSKDEVLRAREEVDLYL